jgi:hypothetical protein
MLTQKHQNIMLYVHISLRLRLIFGNIRKADGTASAPWRIAESGIDTLKSLDSAANLSRKSINAHNHIWSNTEMKNNGNFLQQHKWTKFSWIILRQMLL